MKLASLDGNVLALFGGKDEGISLATIEQFKKAMAKAGKSLTIHVYPECGNSFMDPDSPYLEGKADKVRHRRRLGQNRRESGESAQEVIPWK